MDGVGLRHMRKYMTAFVFTGWAFLASPLSAATATADSTEAAASPSVAIRQTRVAVPGSRDQAAMLLVGTALIGLAAAVRRAA